MCVYIMEYLSSREKEGNPDVWDSMDVPWEHHAKWDKEKKDKYCVWYLLYVDSKKTELMETQNGSCQRVGEVERCWSEGTNVRLQDKFWGSNAQHCDYSY